MLIKEGCAAKNFITNDQWSAWSLTLLKEHAEKNSFEVFDIIARQFGVTDFNLLLDVLAKIEPKRLSFSKSIVNQRDAEKFWDFFLKLIPCCQFGFFT